jgi:XTP/dITP diphosphohydrolase
VTTLIIATRNKHKTLEIRSLLADAYANRTLADFPEAPPVVEDAPDFAGNATKKSLELARWLATQPALRKELASSAEVYCLADDSGLEVDALHGAPGVHSARFAALDVGDHGNSSDAANNAKLLRLLSTVSKERRNARFRCAIALTPVLLSATEGTSPVCYADEAELETEIFDGTCEGWINDVPRGHHGFGYDPLFIPTGFSESFAELGETVKIQISHRAKALRKLKQWLDAVTAERA